MAKRSYPLSKVYGLLEPGPVVLVTTARKGHANIMTMSWHTMMEFEPPLVGCVISGRNVVVRHAEGDEGMRDQYPDAGTGRSRWWASATVPGARSTSSRNSVSRRCPPRRSHAPLIEECYASLECRVADTRLVNRYNFFILEVVQAWVDTAIKQPQTLHHRGNGVFVVAGETVKLRSVMK